MQQENIHLGGALLTQLKRSGAATGIENIYCGTIE
jgi:hypothetical protein